MFWVDLELFRIFFVSLHCLFNIYSLYQTEGN